MGIIEMDFERILGVPFFHSSSHSIMLCYSKGSTTSIQLFIQTLILTDAAIARECSRHLVSRPLWPNVSSKLLEKDSEQQQLCLGSSNAKQLGQISETRQKLDWKIREIDGSYLCLQQFDMFWIWRARYDRKRKLSEYAGICMEEFVKPLWVNLFSASFC